VGTLLLDPKFAVVHNVNPRDYRARAYVIADWALANAMRNADVIVQADRFIDVGTRNEAYDTGDSHIDWILNNLTGPDEINLRDYGTWTLPRTGMQFNVEGTTQGSITFQSNRVNFHEDVVIGDGNVAVDANIVNLDSRIYNPDGTTPLGDDRISSNADTVNVRSNDALIQQGVWFANDAGGATVNVAKGRYTEQVVINKNLTLQGQGVGQTILRSPRRMEVSYTQDGRDNRAIIYVHNADTVNIDGFTINGKRNIDEDYTDNDRFIGVAYHNAGGNFTNNSVLNIATPGNTARSGFGLLATSKNIRSDSTLNISGNLFDNFQTYGIAAADNRLNVNITDNDITGAGTGSGIFAGFGLKSLTIGGSDEEDGNRIGNTEYGIEMFRVSSAMVQNNEITNTMNGIDLSDGRDNQILDNTITGSTNIGIILRNNAQNTTISGNTVSGASMGIVSSRFGRPNGTVILSGNILTNNTIGMLFRTGAIDLTGVANQITGGERGMVFDPRETGNPANLSLVGNTIGNTIFNSQSVYYIELLNDALFAPGNPTVLDARFARFNSISASDDANFVLDTDDYNSIGDKLWHFVQDNTLGLFDFGNLPPVIIVDDEPVEDVVIIGDDVEIDQEQVFRFFSIEGLQTSGLNVTINGLPNTGTGDGGTTPQGLNNITPFAGSDNPDDLNQINPAAGGTQGQQQASAQGATSFACWGDAGGQAGQGTVNVSYGTDLEDALASAASCGSSI
jgi:parallel beta-helix repeat protein